MARWARNSLVIAGALVLILLGRRIGAAAILDALRRSGWAFLWVVALYVAHVVLRAAALWRTLPATLRFRDVLRVRLAGEAIEMLTFTGPFLAEPSKGWMLKRHGIEMVDAFGAIAIEYLLYTAVASWMSVAALWVLLVRGIFGHAATRPSVAILIALGVFTMLCVVAAVRRKGLIAPAIRGIGRAFGRTGLTDALSDKIEPVEAVLVGFMHDRPARLLEVIGVEAAGHALLAVEIWIVLSALGASVSSLDALVFEGAIKLVPAVFFFVPGQLGAAEGVYVLLAEALKFGSAAGITLALIRRLRALVVAAAGLAALALFPEPSV